MKRTLAFLITLVLGVHIAYAGYITMPKTFIDGETLYHSDLNSNYNALNNAITTAVSEAEAAAGDSADYRFPTTVNLHWTDAFGDSVAANDSLTAEIKKQTPLGTTQALYIKNTQGVAERVKFVLDFEAPSTYTLIDSLQFYVWTEATNGTDFMLVSAYEDSTHLRFKGTAAASSDTMYSGTARTATLKSLTGISITGGQIRFEMTVQTVSDSMFISEPKVYMTRP